MNRNGDKMPDMSGNRNCQDAFTATCHVNVRRSHKDCTLSDYVSYILKSAIVDTMEVVDSIDSALSNCSLR